MLVLRRGKMAASRFVTPLFLDFTDSPFTLGRYTGPLMPISLQNDTENPRSQPRSKAVHGVMVPARSFQGNGGTAFHRPLHSAAGIVVNPLMVS
jgi:hypothetical protein